MLDVGWLGPHSVSDPFAGHEAADGNYKECDNYTK